MLTNPMPHQKIVMTKLKNKNAFALFFDMGLGKTWIGIWLIENYLLPFISLKKKAPKKILIICPNSVTDTWVEQFEIHSQIAAKHICILKGTAQERKNLLNQNFNIFIINYEGLKVIIEDLLKIDWEILIADESQKIKSFNALQTKYACALALKTSKKFIFSGTPITKSYLDIFSQWYFLGKHADLNIPQNMSLRAGFYIYRAKYFDNKNLARYMGNFPLWIPKESTEELLKNLILPVCHRLEKDDVLVLPPKVYKTLRCTMTKEQDKAYQELKKEMVTYIKDKSVTVQQAIVKMIRLNQITSGFLPVDGAEPTHEFSENPKLDLLVSTVEEILENPKNKIIIWAHFRKDIEKITLKLKEFNPVTIYGGVEERGKLVKKFQEDTTCRIFIGNAQSAGLGLNLTAANYAIFYSYNFNWGDQVQAAERNNRIGSEVHKSLVYIYLVMKGTIDEAILGSLSNKTDMIESVMSYIKRGGE